MHEHHTHTATKLWMISFEVNKKTVLFLSIFVVAFEMLVYRAIGPFAMNAEIYFLRVKQFTESLTFKLVFL